MKEHIELLGLRVSDVVTGFSGCVTSVSFDLYGCVQAIVTPRIGDDGKQGDSQWFDTKRLLVSHPDRVMECPAFEAIPGGQEKPRYPQKPMK